MSWLYLLSYFLGGAFFTNAVPHFVSGMTGRPFQSPFASPPGQGLSSSPVNILWGLLYLVFFYCLIFHVGNFEMKNIADAIAFGLGMLMIGLFSARHFGRFHGGNINGNSNISKTL
jgi:hypothetical protein